MIIINVYFCCLKVMQQLEEEALMEQCIEAMIEDELENKPQENADFVYDFQKMCVQEKAELARKVSYY
ncbi:hypothetical protein O3M35_004528 [Rhynocoris fuscipes]|uniref:Uncharacterized protein n=1 Tax=Rhynocoris fuscipes TaxID=488301 RepID=A0AAW1CIB9_9HEMI